MEDVFSVEVPLQEIVSAHRVGIYCPFFGMLHLFPGRKLRIEMVTRTGIVLPVLSICGFSEPELSIALCTLLIHLFPDEKF